MTNREWLNKEIQTMTNDEFIVCFGSVPPWCEQTDDVVCDGNCKTCIQEWIAKEHKEPMPELRVGMFVKVRHYHSTEDYIGVITLDENNDKIIVYKETTWDFVASVENNIIAIYNANCFLDCEEDENCIWRA